MQQKDAKDSLKKSRLIKRRVINGFVQGWVLVLLMTGSNEAAAVEESIGERVEQLLTEMSLAEKVGQMRQVHAGDGNPVENLGDEIRAGRIGAILNSV